MSPSRLWLLGCVAALFVFSAPLIVAGSLTKNAPEIRVIQTGGMLSALLVTDDVRLLIINSDDRGITRSAIGRIARPWEPHTTIALAPATDLAAIGLWEVLRSPYINHVLVVGTPGRDALWSRIERKCAKEGIRLEFIATPSEIDVGEVLLSVDPERLSLTLSDGTSRVSMALSSGEGLQPSHVALVPSGRQLDIDADVVVTSVIPEMQPTAPVLVLGERDTLRMVLEQSSVRIEGGRLIPATDSTN